MLLVAPKLLDPSRYHLNPRTDLHELEKGMPWRTIKDELGKFKWIDHEGRAYPGTCYSVEPDVTAKTNFCCKHDAYIYEPSSSPDSERRKEVAHHEEIPGHSKSKKKNASDKKSNFTIKAKSICNTQDGRVFNRSDA